MDAATLIKFGVAEVAQFAQHANPAVNAALHAMFQGAPQIALQAAPHTGHDFSQAVTHALQAVADRGR